MRKKGILFAICIVLNVYLSAETFNDYLNKLEGAWLHGTRLTWYDLNFIPKIYKGTYKEIQDETAFFIKDNNIFSVPMFSINNWRPNVIEKIESCGDNCIEISYVECEYKYSEEQKIDIPVISNYKYKLRVRFLAKDEIQILDCGFDDIIWYKIDGPAVIPEKKAKCNDDRVRLRLKPNLNCQTLGYLNTNDCVIIKDRSDNKFEIDGESWYWYKVDYPELPDGWVYGKYLTYISDKEYTNLLSEHEKKEKAKADALTKPEKRKLTKLEILTEIIDSSSHIRTYANNSRTRNKDNVYNQSKGIYKYEGNSIQGKRDREAIIINNKIFISNEIRIGMSVQELKAVLGEPDEINKEILIYKEKDGNFCEYISSFYIEDGKVIKLVAQQVFFN